MDFPAFFNSISAPALRAVATHWHDARGSETMPSWEDIEPRAIAAQLSIVWVYKYDRATGDFTGRLAGDRIAQLYGKSFRGLPLVETHAPEVFVTMHALFSRVVLEPAAYHGGGRLFKQHDLVGSGERIMPPLSSNGVSGHGILGATDFQLPYIIPGRHVET